MRLSVDSHIATITLSNAIDERSAQQLRDICDSVRQHDDVRSCVITGANGIFCDGSKLSGTDEDEFDRLRVSEAVAAIEKPTIALINGDAIDQGFEIALACDLRVASSDARMGLTHLASGFIPWDGGTQRLPRIIGQSRATDMILRSRLLNAQEALEIGIVSHAAEHERLRNTRSLWLPPSPHTLRLRHDTSKKHC